MEDKFSQILDALLRKRKAEKRSYTIIDLAEELGVSESSMNKYLAGEFDKSDRMSSKKAIAKQLLEKDLTVGDDVNLLHKVDQLNQKVEQLEITINDLQKSLNKILTKLL